MNRSWDRFLPRLGMAILVMLLLGRLLSPSDPYFGQVVPHPFLAIICWASIRHGWLEGLVSALCGCLVLALHPMASLDLTANGEAQFGSMIGFSLFSGLLSDLNQKRAAIFRTTIARQASQILQIDQENQALRVANQALRSKSADVDAGLEMMTLITIQLLALTDTAEIEGGIAAVVAETLQATQCCYYRKGRRGLEMVSHFGWDEVPTDLRIVTSPQDLVMVAAERRQFQSIQTFPEQLLDDPEYWAKVELVRLMATPVLHPTTGAVMGVVSVEKLPFSRFTRGNAALLEAIASLAGKALAQLEGDTRAEDGALEFETEEILTHGAFTRFLRQELQGQLQGSRPPFAAFGLSLDNFDTFTAEEQSLIERFITVLNSLYFRRSDVKGRVGSGRYAILLYNTKLEGASRIMTEYARQIRHALGAFYPKIGERAQWSLALREDRQIGQADQLEQDLFEEATPLDKVPGSDFPPFTIPATRDERTSKTPDKQLLELNSLVGRAPSDLELRIYKISLALQVGNAESLRVAAEDWSLLPILSGGQDG